ncbi:MAG: TatD family hydrolase [Anaerolineae bacterium]|nr:TatD family hydrolase [Anaerolineae bacterium]
MLIDAHAHLDRYDLVGMGAVEAALGEVEAHRILTISNSMDPPSYRRNLEIAAHSDLVLPVFGVHPWNAPEWTHRLDELREPAGRSPMLGEVGLDHYFVEDLSAYSAQRQVLEFFLDVAREQDKVVHLHTKGAEAEVLALVEEYNLRRVVVHWYSGPLDIMQAFAARGAYFTMGLEVRYWDHLVEITRAIPRARLLTETDNPGGPKGRLGRPGTPALIEEVVAAVAKARGESPEEIEHTVQENLLCLFESDPWIEAGWTGMVRAGSHRVEVDGERPV